MERFCVEHDVMAIFDVDCFRCPVGNEPIGRMVRR